MKTLIDIPEETLKALNRVSEECHMSRSELIRQWLKKMLAQHQRAPEDCFGLLKDKPFKDSVEYQRKMRSEW